MPISPADPGNPVALEIGVIIVTFRAADFISDCLESLLACGYPGLKVVVVDNRSPDSTCATIREWAQGDIANLRGDWPFGPGHRAPRPIAFTEYAAGAPVAGSLATVTLIHSDGNLGYAGGVNLGLAALRADPAIDLFWVLNPDTVVEPQTPAAFTRAAQASKQFALLCGRLVFFAEPDRIQIDGGRLGRLTASVSSANFGLPAATTPPPQAGTIAFVSGASMVASRAFIERAGPMDERYFLYFEEIDWQLRRGDLPIVIAPGAVVRHHAGLTIGSGGLAKPAAFSVYFTYRNLLRFVARWFPARLPLAYAFAWARTVRNLDGTWLQFAAFLAGIHQLAPPAGVRQMLTTRDWQRALGGKRA